MKLKKRFLLICIIFVWVVLIYFFALEKQNLELQKIPQFLILDNSFFWKYEDGKWEELDELNDSKLFNWEKFDIYLDNNYSDTYSYVYNDNGIFFFNDNNESMQVQDENLLLLNKESYINLIDYVGMEITEDDEKFINRILKRNDLDNEILTVKLKYAVSEDSYVYVLSNRSDAIDSEDTFTLFVYRTKYRSYLIANKKFNYEYELQNVIDIRSKKPNFILKYRCYNGYCYDMYQYEDKEYKKVAGLEFEE